jgi:hypothetical protein
VTFLASGVQVPAATAEMSLISRIGQLARAHRHAALIEMAATVTPSSPSVRAAYFVARYYSDPKHERRRFVDEFPTARTEAFELYIVTPSILPDHRTYPFDSLAEFARKGDGEAVRKLELVAANSDGGFGEFISTALGETARARPSAVLFELASLPQGIADRVARNPIPWCESAKSIANVAPKSTGIARLQRIIRTSSARC